MLASVVLTLLITGTLGLPVPTPEPAKTGEEALAYLCAQDDGNGGAFFEALCEQPSSNGAVTSLDVFTRLADLSQAFEEAVACGTDASATCPRDGILDSLAQAVERIAGQQSTSTPLETISNLRDELRAHDVAALCSDEVDESETEDACSKGDLIVGFGALSQASSTSATALAACEDDLEACVAQLIQDELIGELVTAIVNVVEEVVGEDVCGPIELTSQAQSTAADADCITELADELADTAATLIEYIFANEPCGLGDPTQVAGVDGEVCGISLDYCDHLIMPDCPSPDQLVEQAVIEVLNLYGAVLTAVNQMIDFANELVAPLLRDRGPLPPTNLNDPEYLEAVCSWVLTPDLCQDAWCDLVPCTDPCSLVPGCDLAESEAEFLTNFLLEAATPAAEGTSHRGTAGSSNDAASSTIPTSGALDLVTEVAEGKWTLSFAPLSATNLGQVEPFPAGTETISFSVAFNDNGQAIQPSSYAGTNPPTDAHEGYPVSPSGYEELPPSQEELREAWLGCAVATGVRMAATRATMAGTVYATSTGGPLAGGAVLVAGGLAVAALWLASDAACDRFRELNGQVGFLEATGKYVLCKGAGVACDGYLADGADASSALDAESAASGSGTRWEGELSVLDIIVLETSVDFHEDLVLETPLTTAPPYSDWYSQTEAYQGDDAEARSHTFGLHNQFVEQVSEADATIDLNVPLLGQATALAEEYVYMLGTTYLGPVYYNPTVQEIVLVCESICGEDTVLTIESPGTGTLVPASEAASIEFAGLPGQATVTILGLTVGGFTLDGELGGAGAGPLSGPLAP